jgi:hypothetical protein
MSVNAALKASRLQKQIIEHLNASDLGCFVFRLKNAPFYDAMQNEFLPDNIQRDFPHVFGWARDGKVIVINVKHWDKRTKNVKRPSVAEKAFLQRAAENSPYVGVAYSLEDAYNIVKNNQETHPREIRTWKHLTPEDKDEHDYANREKRPKVPKAAAPTGCPWLNLSDEPKYKRET